MKVNNDSNNANYKSSQRLYSNSTTTTSTTDAATTSGGAVGFIPESQGTAGTIEILIPVYTSTAFPKPVIAHSAWYRNDSVQSNYASMAMMWNASTAISQIDLIVNSTNFTDNTVATLYGLA